jgi:hypothetical protein
MLGGDHGLKDIELCAFTALIGPSSILDINCTNKACNEAEIDHKKTRRRLAGVSAKKDRFIASGVCGLPKKSLPATWAH